jgi:hypothetical protein
MKNVYVICASLLLSISVLPTAAQTLSKDLVGRWEIKKFQKDKKPELQGGTLEFLTDGTLLTEGVFFGTQKSTFTTDKNNSILTIQNSEGTTAWLATVKNDVLRLKSTGDIDSSERIYITLRRSTVTLAKP